MQVQVRTMPPMQALSYSVKTTLSKIHEMTGEIPMLITQEAFNLQLQISGPQYWIYYGCDGKPETEFTLEIIVPVLGTPAKETKYTLKNFKAFKCAATTHEGRWDTLGETYCKIMPWLTSQGYSMTDSHECREMYVNVDCDQQENNLTEVLVGIK